MRSALLLIPAAALSGCMTLTDLDQKTPVFEWRATSPDYQAVGQCVYSAHVTTHGGHGMQFAVDKAKKQATIVTSTDFGAISAAVFANDAKPGTIVRVYSIGSSLHERDQGLIKACGDAKA